jgi:hypothetical protein
LRICIRPLNGTFVFLAIMDIRARSISFASRPRRPYGPPDHERAGETISSFRLADLGGEKANSGFWDQLEPTLGATVARLPDPADCFKSRQSG